MYEIPIPNYAFHALRQDGRFAVGGEKRGEDSFESIPDLVTFYSAEQKILLKPAGSDGPAGETFLTSA